jgi:hydroxyacylglutathione hydrolase
MGAMTGDFVFVGDVGRPDLLERAARIAGTMESGARTLYRSLQRFKLLPDYLQIWPGHGAGSACGKALGAVPQSTLGYERLFNWAFTVADEAEFVSMVLAGQPEPPTYFAEMKRINKAGPRILGSLRHPERLPASRLPAVLESKAVVVDTRHITDFAASHIPGTWNIPLGRSFTTWMGWLVPYDRDIYLIVDDDADHADRAARDLALIGLDRLVGYFGAEALTSWENDGRAMGHIAQITASDLQQRMARGDIAVIDVRGQAEWEEGHLRGTRNIPVGYLPSRLAEIPKDRPFVVHCQGGTRSAIAASVLQSNGFTNVINFPGGFSEWQRSGLPTENGTSS